MTRQISAERASEPSRSAGIPYHITRVILHFRNRRAAAYNRKFAVRFRGGHCSAHLPYIGHCFSHRRGRNTQCKVVPRFKQYAFSRCKTLTHGAVGCLPKVAALRVFFMGAPRFERNFYIGYRCADKRSDMRFFLQMRQYKSLPVSVKDILAAVAAKFKTFAARQRLKQQMHLRIVAQRLIVTYALNRGGNRFLI